MPHRLTTPVLTVDAAKIHEVDTRNAESLHGMWMVFSKCADYMEQGRRLENLSWRLWNRETFCVPPPITLKARSQPMGPPARELPELSSSVESATSDDADHIEAHINPPPKPSMLELKPAILARESVLSISRGKEKHITSSGLEKMVYNIKQGKYLAPLDAASANQQTLDVTPQPSSPTPVPEMREPEEQQAGRPCQSTESCSTIYDGNESERAHANHSDTSVSPSSLVQSASVVRGFSPAHVSSSYRSHTRLPSTAETSNGALPIQPSPLKRTKKGGMFTLGCSSSDEESSFKDRPILRPQRSSLTDGLARSPAQPKKVASFRTEVEAIRPIREIMTSDDDAAIETDYEEISESAIDDDDDSSDWEDSITESGRSSVDEKPLFQRVDSRPNLVSRPSLLTMMMHQPQRYGGPHGRGGHGSRSTPALQRSRLSSPNGPSTAASPDDYDDENTLTMKGPEFPRAKPIVTRPIPCYSVAYSPRTTRRNMLATELTESLRRNLLMERQQKTTSAAAAFRRRHTAHDMANLQEYPGPNRSSKPGAMNTNNPTNQAAKDKEVSKNNSSWNHYFDYNPWEYHDKGW